MTLDELLDSPHHGRTPAQILADPTADDAHKLVAVAYIRRLLITASEAREALDILAVANIVGDDAYTLTADFLTHTSPYGRYLREKGPYPTPEERFPGWEAITAPIHAATEGLDLRARNDVLTTFYSSELARFVSALLTHR